MSLTALYLSFFKFGLLCFGGGYMLIPLLAADFVGPGKPLTPEIFAKLVSIAQVTPGPIGINTATYVGFTQGGLLGATLATFGMVTPTLLLVILASLLLRKYAESWPVQGFLAGMRPASFGMMVAAGVIFAELSVFRNELPWAEPLALLRTVCTPHPAALAIAAVSLWLLIKTRISFIWMLAGAAVVGAFLCR